MSQTLVSDAAASARVGARTSFRWPVGRTWTVWAVLVGAAVLVHGATLDLSPVYWQDEVQQVDFGRLVLEPEADWSTKWSPQLGRPVRAWSYGGPLLHELAFRVVGLSPRGPRMAALAGAVLAATALLGWLLARGTAAPAAVLLGFGFFLDPLFAKSYKGGRVDGWALAAALAACWMLRRASADGWSGSRRNGMVALAGALAAAAAMAWQSAVIVYPLVALELLYVSRRAFGRRGWRDAGAVLAAFAGGGLAVTALLALPVLPYWSSIAEEAQVFLQTSAGTGAPLSDHLRRLVRIDAAWETYRLSAPLLLLAVLGAASRRETGLVAATLLGYALVAGSVMYSGRALYLIPYLAVLGAGLFPSGAPAGRWPRRMRVGLLLMLLVWTAGATLVARPFIALRERAERSPEGLYAFARNAVGAGPADVFLARTFELYFPGRALGWRTYALNWEGTPEGSAARRHVDQLLDKVDYAIYRRREVSGELTASLRPYGLAPLCGTDATGDCPGVPAGVRHDAQSYGPYVVYGRTE